MNSHNVNAILFFNVIYGGEEKVIEISRYDTIGDLKALVSNHFNLIPELLTLEGWKKTPKNDHEVLTFYATAGQLNNLVLYNSGSYQMETEIGANESSAYETGEDDCEMDGENQLVRTEDSEEMACLSFLEYYFEKYQEANCPLHICKLADAVNQSCFSSVGKAKLILLYLHSSEDKFSDFFCESLLKPELIQLLEENCFIIGWNVGEEKYHVALTRTLNEYVELQQLVPFITKKKSVAFFLLPLEGSLCIFSCIQNETKYDKLLSTVKSIVQVLHEENDRERDLDVFTRNHSNDNDITSTKFQQLMMDMLGNRDYDSFEFDEHEELRQKIAYALFGPPSEEGGYNSKQKKIVEPLFAMILKCNNEVAKRKDRVVISFIYICAEPLPEEKLKSSKKFPDYNPNVDLAPYPVFVLRKCKNSPSPCRIFIDHVGRVYSSWNSYLTHNKMHKCIMVVPRDGRYQADGNGNVLVERYSSPACSIQAKVLTGADVTTTVIGVAAGGVGVASIIPAITVAPILGLVAGVAGIGVGAYAIGRSIHSLVDRGTHRESLNFANSEARGAYLNIVAGAFGFFGAGANLAVAQLAARGYNIGMGTVGFVNVVNFMNVGASGAGVLNSGYDVLDQWFNQNQKPSALTILQLSSSVLFFGHAVYNFRSAGTIVREAQSNVIQEYHESLRSNRHRKTFNKMISETIRQNEGNINKSYAEVIQTIRKIPDKDSLFAALTRNNKNMNRDGIRFAADGGGITLNGVQIDMKLFTQMTKQEHLTYFKELPPISKATPRDVVNLNDSISNAFSSFNPSQEAVHLISRFVMTISNGCLYTFITEIIDALSSFIHVYLLKNLPFLNELNKLFASSSQKYEALVRMTFEFFDIGVRKLEECYLEWKNSDEAESKWMAVFETLSSDTSKRILQLFEFVLRESMAGGQLTEVALRKLIQHFASWLTHKTYEFTEARERQQNRREHSASRDKKTCNVCSGYYYPEP